MAQEKKMLHYHIVKLLWIHSGIVVGVLVCQDSGLNSSPSRSRIIAIWLSYIAIWLSYFVMWFSYFGVWLPYISISHHILPSNFHILLSDFHILLSDFHILLPLLFSSRPPSRSLFFYLITPSHYLIQWHSGLVTHNLCVT